MLALAVVELCSSRYIHRLELGSPDGTTLQKREELADYFVGATRFITAEVDIGDLLRKGADPNVSIP